MSDKSDKPLCDRFRRRAFYSSRRPASPAIACLVLAILIACTSPEPPLPELRQIPQPDLGNAEEAVRQQIEDQRQELRERRDEGDAVRLAEAYGDLGLVYLTYSFLEAAEASFANARSLRDDDYRWPYLLGYLFQIQGRLEEAVATLGRALELRADDPPSLIRLATVRLELGSNAAAAPLFDRVLALDPGSAAALEGLGKVAAAGAEAAAAADYFERALELQPEASSLHHALGLAYRNLGDLEKAESHLSRGGDAAVLFKDPLLSSLTELGRSAELYLVRAAQAFSAQRYAQAETFYRQALEIDPTDFTTRKALGFCLEKLGDVEGAVGQLEEGLRTGASGDPEQDVLERAELLRILGGLRVLQGRDPEAIDAFQRSLELDPERLDSRSKLANALARQGRLEDAVSHYDRILARQPDLSEVLIRRATARINLGQPEAALADFETAVAAAPEDPKVRIRYAEALEHLGKSRAAAAQRAVAAGLSSEPAERARLLADEARRQLRQGAVEAALAGYREALSLDPENADARYQMATALGHLGHFEEALEEFARVIEAAPLHGLARRGEVTALLLMGRYADARSRLQQGLKAMPRHRELAHALARLLAIAPVDPVRDGDLALRIAARIHRESQRSDTAETLAMAFAEAGRFAEARELAKQLVATAEGSGQERMARRWRDQLAAYEQSRPWRARSPDDVIVIMIGSGDGPQGAS